MRIIVVAFITCCTFSTFAQVKDNNRTNEKDLIASKDISPLFFKTKNTNVLGFIGSEHERFRIKFISVIKNKDLPDQYFVYGKNMVKDNVCNFQGTLTITACYLDKDSNPKEGTIEGKFVFFEDPAQRHVGQFKGTFESQFILDDGGKVKYNDLYEDADGFSSNQFAGSWTKYGGTITKECNWGDYRIPKCGDLDTGAGEFVPNEKYRQNGWESYWLAYLGNAPGSNDASKKEEAEWWR